MKDREWMEELSKEEPEEYTNVKHSTVNYIDDSNNVIIFEKPEEANKYVNSFFKTLESFYNINRLKMNGDKTGLLGICRPKHQRLKDNILIPHPEKDVKCLPQIWILGWFLNGRMSYDSTINQNISIIQGHMKSVGKVMSEKQRLMVANSHLMSRLSYGMPLFVGQDETIINAIHRSHMSIMRWVKSDYCFKISVSDICKSLKWDSPRQTIIKNTAKLIKNIITDQEPRQITEYIRMPRTRPGAQISRNFTLKTKDLYKSCYLNL